MNKAIQTSKINSFHLYLSIISIFLANFNANSQTVFHDSINNKKYILIDVHKTYERITAIGYESIEMYEYLGNYYFECKNFRKSKLYFDKLFEKYNLSRISAKSIEQYKTMGLNVDLSENK